MDGQDRFLEFAGFRLDSTRRELWHKGRRVHLQETPFQILAYLAQHPGRLVPREELKQAVWEDRATLDSTDDSLNTAMNRLRHALRACHGAEGLIETHRGLGYCLRADVVLVPDADPAIRPGITPAAGADPATPSGIPPAANPDPEPPSRTETVANPPAPQDTPDPPARHDPPTDRLPRILRPWKVYAATAAVLPLLAVALVRLPGLFPATPESSARALAASRYREAMNEYRRRDFPRARECFRKAIAADSTYPLAYYGWSICEAFAGITPDAEDLARQAYAHIGSAPIEDQPLIESWYLLIEERYAEALSLLEELVRQDPSNLDTTIQLARLYWLQYESPRRALPLFRQILAVDSTDTRALNGLAYCLNRLGRDEEAIRAARRYVAVEPDEHNPYDTLGDMFRGIHPDSGRKYYEMALHRKPDFDVSIAKLAWLALQRSDLDTATRLFRDLLEVGDDLYRSIARRGVPVVVLVQGRFDAALAELSRSIQLDHEDNAPPRQIALKHALRAATCEELGDFEGALRAAEQADSLFHRGFEYAPDSFKYDRVKYMLRLGRLQGADSLARSLPASDEVPNANWAWPRLSSLALLDLASGRFDAATARLRRALDLDPDRSFELRLRLAEALAGAGKSREAVEELAHTLPPSGANLSRDPVSAVRAYYDLRVLSEEVGETGRARKAYEQFLAYWGESSFEHDRAMEVRGRLAALVPSALDSLPAEVPSPQAALSPGSADTSAALARTRAPGP